jgi:acyl-CoA thioester hydrolase
MSADKRGIVFLWQARVYYEDTDAGGIVYYANYLRFLERARTEWLRSEGWSQRALALDPGIVFAVVTLQAQYRRPARLDDVLAISCEPSLSGSATLLFRQRIWRDDARGELLLEGEARVACLDAASLRPRRLPDFIARELK